MKINMEIDLREAFVGYGTEGEEYTADFSDVIKQGVIEAIIKKQGLYSTTEINRIITEKIGKVVEDNINEKVSSILDNFMSKEVTIGNGYDSKKYDSLLKYVEEKMKELYEPQFKGASCNSNVLLDKISTTISNEITKVLSPMLIQIERKGREIAKKTLANDNTLSILKEILQTK